MQRFCRQFLSDQSGATAIEYAFMAALIAVVIAGAVTTLGKNVLALFNKGAGLF